MTPPAGTLASTDVESTTRPAAAVPRGRVGGPPGPTEPAASGAPEAAPRRAEGLELLGTFTGSGYEQSPSIVRRADGQTLQLTPLLYTVLEAMDGRRDHAAIAQVVSRSIGKRAEAEDIAYLVDTKLRPLGVLHSDDAADLVAPTSNPLLSLRWRFVVTNPKITRRLTAPFALLFNPFIAVPMLLGFAAITGWLLFVKGLGSAAHDALYDPVMLLTVVGLTMLSAGFHEFGHAAACRYGGATPGVMGVGLYLVWPAFYTEVSDSYRLDRRGRLRVDTGGLYFNAIFAVGMFAVWWATRWDALLLMIPAQVLQMLRQLLPFVRFDGYHILSDLTGVPDLFAHLKPTLLGLLPKRWRRPHPRPLKRWARSIVTTWVLLVIPFLLFSFFMMIKVMPRVLATVWDSLGMQYDVLLRNWADGAAAEVGVRLVSMLAIALPAASMTYLAYRVTSRTTRRVWRATENRPAHRVAAIVAGAGLVVLLAWLWWPQGQYRPIEANERGALLDVIPPVPPQLVATPVASQQWSSLFAVPDPGIREISGPAVLPATAEEPQLALILTPEGSDTPEQIVLLPPAEEVGSGTERPEWPFSFNRPREARAHDNQALAVNTVDGQTVYDVALAMVWLQDERTVDHRNDAYALASCRDCKTVAVAFEVIMILGRSDVIVPQNIAIAVNYECAACTTYALAVQLIASLTDMPSDAAMDQLDAIWDELETFAENIEDVPLEELHIRLAMVEQAILQVLAEDNGASATSTSAESVNGETTATEAPATGESTTTSDEPSETGTPTPEGDSTAAGDSATTADPSTDSTSETQTQPEPTPDAQPSESAPVPPPAEDTSTTQSSSTLTTPGTEATP